jgi:hypothetical protein
MTAGSGKAFHNQYMASIAHVEIALLRALKTDNPLKFPKQLGRKDEAKVL